MKILHITFSDKGGAGIGAARLHKALIRKNIKSKIFYYNQYLEKDNYLKIINFNLISWKAKLLLKKLIIKLTTKRLTKESVSFNLLNNLDITRLKIYKDADVIHLHWIGNEMMSIKEISLIKKPIVWTLHDMWPFCGVEHFSYQKRHLKQYKFSSRDKKEKGLDYDNFFWRLKNKYLGQKKINFISPSEWIEKNFIKSKTFNNYNIIKLPYLLDLNKWRNKIKKVSGKKIILLFNATSSVDYRKGFKFLFKAINKYLDKDKFILYVVGERPKLFNKIEIEKKYFGKIDSETKLKKIFSSSNIFILPSIAESFGQVFIEAGSMGLPCVCFKNTGATEIIKHKKNGYAANFESSQDLAKGILWCKRNLQDEKTMKKIQYMTYKNFSTNEILYKYIEYYKSAFHYQKKGL